MTNTLTADKLKIQSGQSILLLDAPIEYLYLLGNPENSTISLKPRGTYDVVQIFVKNKAELKKKVEISMKSLNEDGSLWISFPNENNKPKVEFTKDKTWSVIQEFGFNKEDLISINESWSVVHFVRSENKEGSVVKSFGRKEFLAELVDPSGIGAIYFIVPFNVYSVYRTKQNVRVKGTIEGVSFFGNLVPRGKGIHYMVVTKELLYSINKTTGDTIKVVMEADLASTNNL